MVPDGLPDLRRDILVGAKIGTVVVQLMSSRLPLAVRVQHSPPHNLGALFRRDGQPTDQRSEESRARGIHEHGCGDGPREDVIEWDFGITSCEFLESRDLRTSLVQSRELTANAASV